jgi:FKBP-type peptidyl-prolyl cis-trans isomerase 2
MYQVLASHLPLLCRQGGLEVDKVVELQNGRLAKVLSIDDEHVVLDANNMLAGLERFVEVELLHIERPDA